MPSTAREIIHNGLKEKLRSGGLATSMTVRLVRSIEIAQIAKTAGFDSFYLDNEHNSFSLDTTGQICIAALSVGITPLVRVPSLSPSYIARVLDGGAMGIIAPHVCTAKEAQDVVLAAKFPPIGQRAMTGLLPHLRYQSFPASETVDALNDATMVVVMIETAEALANVDMIAGVPGVDLLLIGTNDLTASLGIPGRHRDPAVRDAYRRCIEACAKHGKHLGIGGMAGHPDLIADFVKMGARYVSTGNDLSFLLSAAAAKAKEIAGIPMG